MELEERRQFMKHRFASAVMAMSLSFGAVPAMLAAPLAAPAAHNDNGRPAKVKTISFQLKNSGSSVLTVQAGTQQYTIQPGQTADLKVPTGTQVTAITATAHVAAGGVITTVDESLKGNTLNVS